MKVVHKRLSEVGSFSVFSVNCLEGMARFSGTLLPEVQNAGSPVTTRRYPWTEFPGFGLCYSNIRGLDVNWYRSVDHRKPCIIQSLFYDARLHVLSSTSCPLSLVHSTVMRAPFQNRMSLCLLPVGSLGKFLP